MDLDVVEEEEDEDGEDGHADADGVDDARAFVDETAAAAVVGDGVRDDDDDWRRGWRAGANGREAISVAVAAVADVVGCRRQRRPQQPHRRPCSRSSARRAERASVTGVLLVAAAAAAAAADRRRMAMAFVCCCWALTPSMDF